MRLREARLISTLMNPRQLKSVGRNLAAVTPGKVRESQEQFRRQVEDFNRMARILSRALEELVGTAEVLQSTDVPPVDLGINFYAEIRRYEVTLIKRALRHAGVSQTKAAALLKLNKTTFHSKIKHYAIRAREYERAEGTLSATP